MRQVYSPCVEPLNYTFAGRPKVLAPGITNFDHDGEAVLVTEKFRRFGVCLYAKKYDAEIKKAAKAVWEAGNKKWAEEVVTDFHQSNKAKLDAGVPVEEPSAVKTAKKLLKVATVLLALLIPTASWAQTDQGQMKSANFTYKYDVASTTMTYCAIEGQQGDPYATPYTGAGRIQTSGSNTTVTTVDSSGGFAPVNIGDVIFVRFQDGSIENRIVLTNADDDTITVEAAIDLTGGFTWSYKQLTCGTSEDSGWILTSGYQIAQFGVQYDAGDLTALAATFECKSDALGAKPVRVYPGISSDCGDGTLNGKVCEFTSVGDRLYFKLPHNVFTACRVGVAYVTADGGTRDEITAVIDVGR
jgi:hypothetical protein